MQTHVYVDVYLFIFIYGYAGSLLLHMGFL